MNTIEIEPAELNANLYIHPLCKALRGHLDFNRIAEPLAKLEMTRFPSGVPGQTLVIDFSSGEGLIIEKLHEPQNRDLRATIEKLYKPIGPERETFQIAPEMQATWVFWIQRYLNSGLARLIRGTVPADVEGNVRKRFIVSELKDERDLENERLKKENRAFRLASLTPAQRKVYDEEMSKPSE